VLSREGKVFEVWLAEQGFHSATGGESRGDASHGSLGRRCKPAAGRVAAPTCI
jgi:hypothetical protein